MVCQLDFKNWNKLEYIRHIYRISWLWANKYFHILYDIKKQFLQSFKNWKFSDTDHFCIV